MVDANAVHTDLGNLQVITPIAVVARPVPGLPAWGRNLVAGVITGQIAGLIMATAMIAVFAVFLGKDPLYPLQVIGAFVFGEGALTGFHLPAFLAGVALHQWGPSFVWGAAFGLAAYALSLKRGVHLVALGLATGLLAQIVDVELILPVAFRALHGHDIWAEQVPAFWSWTSHVVFGLSLGLFPVVNDRLSSLVRPAA
jgi:hypothetical protein